MMMPADVSSPVRGIHSKQHAADSVSTCGEETVSVQARIARGSAFVVLACMFLPVITGRVYVCDDLLNYHLPIRQFYADCLKNGDAFDWMPGLFSGFFLTGSGQAGTYHPFHWLLYRFLSLETAFNLEILSSYPLMLFGMKLFLQRHLRRADAAWLGATVFAFSGFCMLHFLHPNAVAVVAHIPWLLLTHDVILRPESLMTNGRRMALAGLALLTGSQLLLGYPQYVWFSLLAEVFFCLGFVSFTGAGLKTLLLITLAKGLGLGLGAVQILPSMSALAESDRTAMPAEYFYQHPITLPDLLQLVHPFLTTSRVFGVSTHELGLYCGALPLLLGCVAVCGLRSSFVGRRLLQVMLVTGFVALWLSFGEAGGLYVVQTWLPMVGKFRWPSRGIVLVHLVMSVAAAVGYARLTSPSVSPQISLRWLPTLFLLPVLSGLAVGVVLLIWPGERIASWSLLITGPVLMMIAAVMVRDLIHGRFSRAFMVFLCGDLAAYGFTYEALHSVKSMSQVMQELQPPPGLPSEGRIIAETHISDHDPGFGGNELLLAGWKQADGYDGLLPQLNLLDHNISLEGLRVSGVRWIVNAGNHARISGLKPTSDPRWLEVPSPFPRVRLSTRVRTVPEISEAVKVLSRSNAHSDPSDGAARDDHTVIVDRELPALLQRGPGEGTSGTALIDTDRPGGIRITVSSSDTQLLVLAERHHSGWRAYVDDVPCEIVRTNVEFMGCVVPPGQHTVTFEFEPSSVRRGLAVSLASGSLLLTLLVFSVRGISTRKITEPPS